MLMTKQIVSLNSRIILFKRLGIFPLRMNIYTLLIEFVLYNQKKKLKICQCIILIGLQKLSETQGATSQFLATDGWHEESSMLGAHIRVYTRCKRAKFCRGGDLDSAVSILCIKTMNKCHLHKAVANVSCFRKIHTTLASNFSEVYHVEKCFSTADHGPVPSPGISYTGPREFVI
jgi:hypothetical protein